MTLKSIFCGILHHACRIRTYCPTMVSSFKLSPGQSAYSIFSRKELIYKEKNLEFVGLYQMHCSLVEAAFCVTHAEDQMLEIYRVRTDNIKGLCQCASRTPSPRSLSDHGFVS